MLLKQSTARNIPILMVDDTDHITGKTGLTLTIEASKNGASFGSISPTVTELTHGWYNLALTTSHTDTLGALCLNITSTGADPVDERYEVVASLPGTLADDLYHADICVTRQSTTRDEYSVTWFKNGVRVPSGITSPTIQIVKRADGTDLVASTAMTQIGTTGSYKYDASGGEQATLGEANIAIVGATIDGSARSFSRLISRDS